MAKPKKAKKRWPATWEKMTQEQRNEWWDENDPIPGGWAAAHPEVRKAAVTKAGVAGFKAGKVLSKRHPESRRRSKD